MMAPFVRIVVVPLLAAGLSCAADLYRVAGVVMNSETSAPLARAHVALHVETGMVIASQVTGPDGRFSLDVPRGHYHLHAGTRDVMEVYSLRAPDATVATDVITGPESNTSNLVFRWYPLSAISGRIVDENGDPVEDALVQLVAARMLAGRPTKDTMAWARTDDRGEYRFGRLPGGTYYLAVTGQPWYASRRAVKTEATASVAYAPLYYPNSNDPSHATPLILKPGEEGRADFSLRPAAGATINVSYDQAQKLSAVLSLIREGLAGTDGFQRQDRTGPGAQALEGVPPGRYMVRVAGTADKGPVSARQWIDVNGSDLDVKLTLRAAPSVSGTLQWTSSATRPHGPIMIRMVGEDRGVSGVTASVRPDGSFTLPTLPVGRYRPTVRDSHTFIPAEVHVEGADFRNGVVDLSEDEVINLRIVVSGEIGEVKGFVMKGDQPVESVMVALAPVQDSDNWMDYRGYQSDSDGSFDIRNVPAGEYFLFAVDDPNLEYTNPVANRAYYPNATRVTVETGKVNNEKIGLLERISRNPR